MSKQLELGRLFYREIIQINDNEQKTTREKVEAFYALLHSVFVEITRDENIHFTTLFARISYVCYKYNVSSKDQLFIHTFRRNAPKAIKNTAATESELAKEMELGLKVLAEIIQLLFNAPMPEVLYKMLPPDGFYHISRPKIKAKRDKVKVVLLEDDIADEKFIAQDEENPDQIVYIKYNIPERNENFNPTIRAIRNTFGFPILVNLIDVEVDQAGVYRPRAFVVEPDYLVDVTAIAECFSDSGTEPMHYIVGRFKPMKTSISLLLGNIANFFLDELIANPDLNFQETFPKVFKQSPLSFALMNNEDIKELQAKAQLHFNHLQEVIKKDFVKQEIKVEDCYLEPSFYSEKYGIQGRLDLLHRTPNNTETHIIELKSGKPFKANNYGINHSHFTQTLLYDLMIKSTFGEKIMPVNYILYSVAESSNLRFAPTIKSQQYEAIQVRNQIVAQEQGLMNLNKRLDVKGKPIVPIFSRIKANLLAATGFFKTDVSNFEKIYEGLSPLERDYFHGFAGFIAREHRLAKTGVQGSDNINGIASLWLDDADTKEDKYNIIRYLELTKHDVQAENPMLYFSRTAQTSALANFRIGDIVVLYPYPTGEETVLSNQIFKCTIIDINPNEVVIRLRFKQFNDSIFKENKIWNIEPDMLDSSFVGMYRSLFEFLNTSPSKRELLLTNRAPRKSESIDPQSFVFPELTNQQEQILNKIIQSEEYFLLWGPPGSGKTSMMLYHLVKHLMENTQEQILLLAYTNRAVDEICEAIDKLGNNIRDKYFRIGSRYSTATDYVPQLLEQKMSHVTKRADLKELIDQHRIVVATVSSMNSKTELFQLKTFDRIVIDEASQLLEPQLVGLLPFFKRFVLIGDHRQLPAVVSQEPFESETSSEHLKAIGLDNLRHSYFERLYKRCIENKWDWAYDCLSQQGRMHEDIVAFPSRFFYEGNLSILPKMDNQSLALNYLIPNPATVMEDVLARKRFVFFPTAIDKESKNGKTNIHEAILIADLIETFLSLYALNHIPLKPNSIGVITPYRAQIAQIQALMNERNIDHSMITVDTVERYQGGARDIILISLCTNHVSQLRSLVSMSADGVDRKLNVALTRAKKHLVIVGNQNILSENDTYAALMKEGKI